ncbi:fibronectin type III domain-containing protein [Saccharothrix deserti]|uniref:fibronectin type III domain-containing protein n=1 Tax=Saccharothrix deserti TaxID=2593674 RepID=UPI00131BF446|nr:fibronectin type III domain-containing protein [Saccharothrix deserti]
MRISVKWRGRVPVALLTAASLTVAGLAIGGASGVPQLEFLQSGHWVLNSALGKVFHVDGATKQVNAEVAMPDAEQGSLVVQSDSSGYVIGKGKYTEFGKSTLRVEGTTAAPTEAELPVALEGAGGPYLIYRETGRVVRLSGDEPTPPIAIGERLGHPVATPDGTLWLHKIESGQLCHLSAGATAPSCPAAITPGHTGGLTVVGDQPVFVDTTADTMQVVEDNGLGRPKAIGKDMPDTTKIGPGDVTGRVPMVDPAGTLYLVDTADVVGDRPPAQIVTVPLGPGDYAVPEATGSTVAVLDQRGGTLHTYDGTGGKRGSTPVPAERGSPRLTKGEDKRLYVESGEGKHVLVVDIEGKVTPVPVDGTGTSGSRTPEPPPSESTTTPPITTTPPPAVGTQQPPAQQQPTQRRQTPPPPPPIPASPPGAPGGLNATPGNGSVVLAWGAAAANGASVTAYQISWNGGSASVGGGERGFTASGLANGTAYTFTVVAQNSAGSGPPASAAATPRQPMTITVSRGPDYDDGDTCRNPDCAYMHIEMRGFAPNTDYRLVPYSSNPDYSNGGATVRTDAQGNKTTDRFYYGSPGRTVWVVAGGVESNRLYWEDR